MRFIATGEELHGGVTGITLGEFGLDAALKLARDGRTGVDQRDALAYRIADQRNEEGIVGAAKDQRVSTARQQR